MSSQTPETESNLPESKLIEVTDLSEFSFDLFQTAEHLESAELIAKRLGFEGIEFEVAVNQLFLKSPRARKLTALRWLALKAHAVSIVVRIAPELWEPSFFPPNATPEFAPESGYLCDVSFKQSLVFASKVIAHRVFRIFRSHHYQGGNVTRAWVEVSEKMYPQMFSDSHVLLYPFPLNFLRQFRFFKRAIRSGGHVSLEGVPYEMKGLLLPFVPAANRLKHLVKFEHDAYIRHAQDFMDSGVQEIRTSDEFEVGAVALYKRVGEFGIRSLNSAHGVGNYGPYQAYNKFEILSARQSEFYRLRNSEMEFSERKMAGLDARGADSGATIEVTLVFIHQNFSDLNLVYEDRIQTKAIRILKEIAKDLAMSFVVKAHPNTREKQIAMMSLAFRAKVSRDIRFAEIKPIFVTLNSTAFFDFRHLGPVVFYAEGSLNPNVYFADSTNHADADSLRDTIVRLIQEREA